jgi:hypothetical protein
MRVRAAHPRLFGTDRIRVEVNNLIECMDAGIRASGTNSNNRLRGKFRQRSFDTVLHSLTMWLRLPALPRLPVIHNAQGDASHDLSMAGRTN